MHKDQRIGSEKEGIRTMNVFSASETAQHCGDLHDEQVVHVACSTQFLSVNESLYTI